MRPFRSRSAARLALLAIPAVMAPLLPATAHTVTAVADQYLVVLRDAAPGPADSSARQQVRQQAVAEGGGVLFDYGTALNGFAATLPPDALAAPPTRPPASCPTSATHPTACSTQPRSL